MAVILKMDTGDNYRVDRQRMTDDVASEINDARGKGRLLAIYNDEIPSRVMYIDPDHVVSVRNDGY